MGSKATFLPCWVAVRAIPNGFRTLGGVPIQSRTVSEPWVVVRINSEPIPNSFRTLGGGPNQFRTNSEPIPNSDPWLVFRTDSEQFPNPGWQSSAIPNSFRTLSGGSKKSRMVSKQCVVVRRHPERFRMSPDLSECFPNPFGA